MSSGPCPFPALGSPALPSSKVLYLLPQRAFLCLALAAKESRISPGSSPTKSPKRERVHTEAVRSWPLLPLSVRVGVAGGQKGPAQSHLHQKRDGRVT